MRHAIEFNITGTFSSVLQGKALNDHNPESAANKAHEHDKANMLLLASI